MERLKSKNLHSQVPVPLPIGTLELNHLQNVYLCLTPFGLVKIIRPDVNSLDFSANPSKSGVETISQPESSRAREIGVLLPNNQRQHRTLHIQKGVLPHALC